ncbi:MAG: hypothetical protein H6744_05985 [Deltaproteobacteria bacterium]|nr:hypothetical protein [Deltaproteobacteria bacterium]MCB9786228.1 hypothetical protein [Deltaproteobacteria bacterium]
MKRLILAVSLVCLSFSPVLAAGPPAPTCEGLDLLSTLSGLHSTPELSVTRRGGRVVVTDIVRSRELFTADCLGVHPPALLPFERPGRDRAARSLVQKDRDGAVLYTVSATARGATIWTFAAGAFAERGLHVASFDDDDLTVTDDEGALVFQRQTSDVGALIEREGRAYGCGCERTVAPDGRVAVRPL